MYNIEITYLTGNSFGSNQEIELLDNEGWKNLEIVKENLKRIKLHHDWVEDNGRWGKKKLQTPNFIKEPFSYETEYSIPLLSDNGNEYKISCFWIGYFESLINIKIVMDPELNEMEYSFH